MFSKVLVKESLADALVGQLKIAKSGKDTVIANMISTKGYIGAALADAYLESVRSGESSPHQ